MVTGLIVVSVCYLVILIEFILDGNGIMSALMISFAVYKLGKLLREFAKFVDSVDER